jgi:hypothetical protein
MEYVLSLCAAINEKPSVSLRITVRIGTQNSTFNVEASKVIHGIVTFSPAPESVSLEFLNELGQVDGLEQLGNLNFLTN